MRRADTIAGVCALAIHAVIALILISAPPPKAHASTTVDIEIKKTPPPKPLEPPITKPEPPKPEPERKIVEKVKVAPAPVESPLPPKPTNEPPPKEPVKPVYEVKEVVEGGDDNVAVQHGNNGNTLANPNANPKGPSQPMPSGTGSGPPQPSYKPVSDVFIKKLPEIDGEACARGVPYPSEAQEQGIEGTIEFKVSLDEQGHVHDIKQTTPKLGGGLDEAALNALKHKCRFSPAIGTDGKPAAYVISKYSWSWDLPR